MKRKKMKMHLLGGGENFDNFLILMLLNMLATYLIKKLIQPKIIK